jgi:hypothetical protein
MKIRKNLALILIAAVCVFAFAACGSNGGSESGSGSESSAPSDEIVVDKDAGEVIIPAEVNGKYFTEPTRHGVVSKDGSNGEKSVLRGLVDEKEFYQALVDIGATPGNNVTMENMNAGPDDGVSTEGSKLDVFVTWEGLDKEIPFDDIIKASDERPADIRFGGNLENAKAKNTGCILCLDSCAVGITSNAAYPTGSTQNDLVKFYGDDTVLPADGTRVSVIFRLAE